MKIVGVGQINFWNGGSLWIGQSQAPVDSHAHHALQLTIGLKGKVRFRAGNRAWAEYEAAFVPSHLPHAFEATGSTTATVFCEPESQLGRRLLARFGSAEISAIEGAEMEEIAGPLRAAYAAGVPDGELNEVAIGALATLARTPAPRTEPTDSRVLKAIAEIAAQLENPLSLSQIADAIHLSPSRFRHLFVSQTGMPFRPYLLWLRLLHALELGVKGESWTDAAHASAFVDSAHLTRTFRRMFGVAPTALGRAPQPEAGRADLLAGLGRATR